ncbi:MAG: holdfast attachment protein HfaA [Brevundimonas sp.]|nr:MAG: holdfast attachment protein HfaA [Brevundimonas sp.]
MPASRLILIAAIATTLPVSALAQTSGSAGASSMQAGYGNARGATQSAQSGSTRDANGNRIIVNGLIQAGASSYSSTSGGVASGYYGAGTNGATIGGATAIGNSLNVVVQGSWNTVIVNSDQVNNGDVTAGTALNGTLSFP